MSIHYLSLKKALLLLILIYVVYLTKSALGIDLSHRYSLPQFVKYPLLVTDCVVDLKVNFCKKALR